MTERLEIQPREKTPLADSPVGEADIAAQYGLDRRMSGEDASARTYSSSRESFDSAPTEHAYLRAALDHINYAEQHGKSFSFRRWAHGMMQEAGIDGTPDDTSDLNVLVDVLERRIRRLEQEQRARADLELINAAVREGTIKTFMRSERFQELQELTGAESLDDVARELEIRAGSSAAATEAGSFEDTAGEEEEAQVAGDHTPALEARTQEEPQGPNTALNELLARDPTALVAELDDDMQTISDEQLEAKWGELAQVLGVSNATGLRLALRGLASETAPAGEFVEPLSAHAEPAPPEVAPPQEAFVSLQALRDEREKWIAEYEREQERATQERGVWAQVGRWFIVNPSHPVRHGSEHAANLYETIGSLDAHIKLTKQVAGAQRVKELEDALRLFSYKDRMWAKDPRNPFNQSDQGEYFDFDAAIGALRQAADDPARIGAVPAKFGIQQKLAELLNVPVPERAPVDSSATGEPSPASGEPLAPEGPTDADDTEPKGDEGVRRVAREPLPRSELTGAMESAIDRQAERIVARAREEGRASQSARQLLSDQAFLDTLRADQEFTQATEERNGLMDPNAEDEVQHALVEDLVDRVQARLDSLPSETSVSEGNKKSEKKKTRRGGKRKKKGNVARAA
ncbi:hypothetical protein GVX82_02085 [Patescibacteria group bacterium]|jgi:hypothetical protein|nr:hypothetical protein [Patescibacteria group bacterium]